MPGADDDPHHCRPEAVFVDVPRRLVVIMFRLLIRRSGWPPSSAHHASSIRHPHRRTWVYGASTTGNDYSNAPSMDYFRLAMPLPTTSSTSTTSNVDRHPWDDHGQTLIMALDLPPSLALAALNNNGINIPLDQPSRFNNYFHYVTFALAFY